MEDEAKERGISKSAVIRDCITRTLRKGRNGHEKVSCLDLIGVLAGSFRGPRDLSTNRRYLREALSAHARRKGKSAR